MGMRIEPRVLDWNIEKKSLREEKPVQDMDSYESLFIDDASLQREETLSKLEVIDDEDRRIAEKYRQAAFDARNLGQAFVPNMNTLEMQTADSMESFESSFAALESMLSPEQKEAMEKATAQLAADIDRAF